MNNVPKSLPKQLAIPQYDVCNKLEIRKSLGYVHQLYNWRKIDPSKSHKSLANLSLKYNWTGLRDEEYFHLVANTAAFMFGTIFKAIFDINTAIEYGDKDTILTNFQKILDTWDDIMNNLTKMFEGNEPQNFYYKIRMFLTGFSNAKLFPDKFLFEGVFDEKGNEVRVEGEGGTVGCDPSFQIFERSFGINYKGDLAIQQNALKEGMVKPHRNLIKFLEEDSKIRGYVLWKKDPELIEGYNKVVDKYVKYNNFHWGFIEKYILKAGNIKLEGLKGQGNTPLAILYNKGDAVAEFLLSVENK